MKNQKSPHGKFFKRSLSLFVSVFALMFILSCNNELYDDAISKDERTKSETVSFKDVYNELRNPLLKQFMKGKLKTKLNTNPLARTDEELIDFEKIIKDGDYTTYLKLMNEYTPAYPYIEYFVITKKDSIEKAGYIKYIPEENILLTDTQKISPNTFSGKIQMKDVDEVVYSESDFKDGQRLMAVATTECHDVITVYAYPCSHGGGHMPGQSCNNGLENDAHYEISSQTICNQHYSFIIAPDAAVGSNSSGGGGQLRKVLGLAKGNPNQAHHMIAWASDISQHEVVQRAAANGFHMNEAANGVAVAAWRNQPNHDLYNNRVLQKLTDIYNENPNMTPQQAEEALSALMGHIRNAIVTHPNTHLNNIIF